MVRIFVFSTQKVTSKLSIEKMKLTNKEKAFINGRRKFINTINNSKTILKYRKSSRPSLGESKIIKFLNSEIIKFKREWFFNGLYNNSTKQLLYFDFYLPDYNCCIEFDGEQHYSPTKSENEKINDFLKNAFCLKNNIPLLRIKFTDFNNIELLICKFFDKNYGLSGI